MPNDRQIEWVGRVLGFAGHALAGDAQALLARLAQTAQPLSALKAEGAPELPQLLTALEAARSGLAGPDGPVLLDTLEQLIARARSAGRGRQAKTSNVRGIAYPKLLLVWRAAQGKAQAVVAELGRIVLAMPEVQTDPRFDLAKQAVTMLPGLIPELGSELADLLDKGINAGSDAAIASDALATITTYRRNLAAAATLGRLDGFAKTYGGGLSVLATLDGALASIASNLSAA
jgi:hypothetical protein